MEFFQKILELDKDLFLYLNGFYSDYWDTIMLMVTRKETWYPLYLIIIFFAIRNYRNKSLLVLFFLALTILASDQISVLFKETIQRLRPVHEPEIQSMVHNVLRKGGLYGFVSSHAANTFAIFVFTAHVFKNRGFSVLMLFWAVLVSYSRIYSGVHYPLDIIGGALIGWGIGYGLFKALIFIETHFFLTRNPKIEKTGISNAHSGVIFIVFFVLMSTVFITSGILHHYGYL
ncbi:MAG: phosphatase PAP2 family protein [Prolixibacteraceae bacterium]|nr:phosphatase PAP2 family protein [Prolixibacteraceae bacterium]